MAERSTTTRSTPGGVHRARPGALRQPEEEAVLLNFRVLRSFRDRLKEQAEAEGTTVSALVRAAVEERMATPERRESVPA